LMRTGTAMRPGLAETASCRHWHYRQDALEAMSSPTIDITLP
jgi:hypothetical protein